MKESQGEAGETRQGEQTRARPSGGVLDGLLFYRGRSLWISIALHAVALLAVAGLVQLSIVPWGEQFPRVTEYHLAKAELPVELPEEIIEPPIDPTYPDPDPDASPELVEAPFVPTTELPVDPPAPDPLDWNPPEDPTSAVTRLNPEPPPMLEESNPVDIPVEPVEPAPSAPVVLSGEEIPQVIESPMPRYPRRAVRMRWQGTVVLRIQIDADGKVLDVRVFKSSGHSVLDESALKAFRKWVFRARVPGEPDVRLLQKPFTFRL